jgi:predicted tellurium resistance membrane protein TerC
VWELLTSPDAWIAFLALTGLELVLGIDNIIFISIIAENLPENRREWGRRLGLFLAMFMRIALLSVLSWLIGLTQPLFTVFGFGFSGRDIILISGGLFLLWKSTKEIHELLEGQKREELENAPKGRFSSIIIQIMIIDLVFSLDSIITAVGMVEHLPVMIAAVIASVGLMMAFATPVGNFVSGHPTIKMLALAFLVVIGVVLVADGLGHHVPKGYIYFAMAFSVAVEMLNMRVRKSSEAAKTVKPVPADDQAQE